MSGLNKRGRALSWCSLDPIFITIYMKIHPSLQVFFKTIFQGSHKRSTSLRAYKNIYPKIICKCVNPFAHFIYLRSSVGRYSDKASLIYMTQINILSTSTITMLPCFDVVRSCPHLPHESNQIWYDSELFHLATGDLYGLSCDNSFDRTVAIQLISSLQQHRST